MVPRQLPSSGRSWVDASRYDSKTRFARSLEVPRQLGFHDSRSSEDWSSLLGLLIPTEIEELEEYLISKSFTSGNATLPEHTIRLRQHCIKMTTEPSDGDLSTTIENECGPYIAELTVFHDALETSKHESDADESRCRTDKAPKNCRLKVEHSRHTDQIVFGEAHAHRMCRESYCQNGFALQRLCEFAGKPTASNQGIPSAEVSPEAYACCPPHNFNPAAINQHCHEVIIRRFWMTVGTVGLFFLLMLIMVIAKVLQHVTTDKAEAPSTASKETDSPPKLLQDMVGRKKKVRFEG